MFTNERLFTIQAFTITRVHCIYKVFWHCKMNFIKVFKMLLKRQYLYSSGWLILLHFFKKNLGRVPGVLFFALILKKKLGRVPGVFWIVLFFALILKKNWGVFWACSGRVVLA